MSRTFVNHGMIAIGLFVAFLIMASIFVPKKLQADEAPLAAESAAHSSGARGRLPLLGELESQRYTVRIYGTPDRPLYTVCDRSGRELASLLSAEQVAGQFPDLPLPDARALHSLDAGAGEPNW